MKNIKNILLVLALVVSTSYAGSYVKTRYIKVTKHIRIVKIKKMEVPYQSCHYESIPVTHTTYVDEYERNNAAPLLGGIAGGILGHQIGRGRGRDVATVVGAIAGGSLANRKYGRIHHRRPVTTTTYEQKRVCNTYYKTKRIRKVLWKNIGYMKGQKIVKISRYKLRKIPVRVRISY